MTLDLDLLKECIPFKWRVQNFSKSSTTAVCVAYIDARDVMDMLDACVGVENWQSDYKEIKGNLYAGIAIKINSEWIWKWDCGTESHSDKAKGEASDAFKRSAVKWGIGRFLYDIPVQYCKSNEPKKDNNYPFIVDEEGNKVKNLSDYINQREKVVVFQSRTKNFNKNKNSKSTPVPLEPRETDIVAIKKIDMPEDDIPEDLLTIEEKTREEIEKLISDLLSTASDLDKLLEYTKELCMVHGISRDDSYLKSKYKYNKDRINDTKFFFEEIAPLTYFSDISSKINEITQDYPTLIGSRSFFADIINKVKLSKKEDLEALKILIKNYDANAVKDPMILDAFKNKKK